MEATLSVAPQMLAGFLEAGGAFDLTPTSVWEAIGHLPFMTLPAKKDEKPKKLTLAAAKKLVFRYRKLAKSRLVKQTKKSIEAQAAKEEVVRSTALGRLANSNSRGGSIVPRKRFQPPTPLGSPLRHVRATPIGKRVRLQDDDDGASADLPLNESLLTRVKGTAKRVAVASPPPAFRANIIHGSDSDSDEVEAEAEAALAVSRGDPSAPLSDGAESESSLEADAAKLTSHQWKHLVKADVVTKVLKKRTEDLDDMGLPVNSYLVMTKQGRQEWVDHAKLWAHAPAQKLLRAFILKSR